MSKHHSTETHDGMDLDMDQARDFAKQVLLGYAEHGYELAALSLDAAGVDPLEVPTFRPGVDPEQTREELQELVRQVAGKCMQVPRRTNGKPAPAHTAIIGLEILSTLIGLQVIYSRDQFIEALGIVTAARATGDIRNKISMDALRRAEATGSVLLTWVETMRSAIPLMIEASGAGNAHVISADSEDEAKVALAELILQGVKAPPGSTIN